MTRLNLFIHSEFQDCVRVDRASTDIRFATYRQFVRRIISGRNSDLAAKFTCITYLDIYNHTEITPSQAWDAEPKCSAAGTDNMNPSNKVLLDVTIIDTSESSEYRQQEINALVHQSRQRLCCLISQVAVRTCEQPRKGNSIQDQRIYVRLLPD
jgi:hypothetical protein